MWSMYLLLPEKTFIIKFYETKNNLIFSVAEDRFLESLQLVESLPPEDSYTYFLAVLKNLGSFYMQFKKFDLTAPLYEKAYDVATKVSVCVYRHQSVSQCFPQHAYGVALSPGHSRFFLSNSESNQRRLVGHGF